MAKKRPPAGAAGGGGGKRSSQPSSSSSRLFAAVSRLDTDDARASRARRSGAAADLSRSMCARSQADVSSGLIECRILLQRALAASSRGGGGDVGDGGEDDGEGGFERRERNGGGGDDGADGAADRLLARLLEARRRLCLPSDPGGGGGDAPDYGALISGSAGDEDGDGGGGSLEEALQSEYERCRSEWRETLDRRHRDLRLRAGLAARSSSRFRAVDRGFWEQVEATAAHEALMREQTARGGDGDGVGPESGNEPAAVAVPTFDDSKVYQHLLREFVALGGAGRGGAGGAGAAADAAAERLRRAAQKKRGGARGEVDRRASKGRKIRYAVNPKLANFTFPVPRPVPAISDDDWFKSLFGGAGRAS